MATEHCSFCGKHKKAKADVMGPKVVLVANEKSGKAICQHCIAKSLALLNDPARTQQPVINITDLVSPDGPRIPPTAA